MALSVVMPALEMAQETGKLVSWLKKEGEQVRKGEMLLEVETDKAVVEIEAAGDGVLAGITAREGDVIPVGRTIAWLLQPGEAVPTAPVISTPTGRRTDASPVTATAAGDVAMMRAVGGSRISPKARRLAKEHGVDIAGVRGSGPGGEIIADDILAAAETVRLPSTPLGPGKPDTTAAHAEPDSYVVSGSLAAPKPQSGGGGSRTDKPAVEAVSSIGRLMAERTTQSWTSAPHFFMTRDVDATALNAARETLLPVIEASHGVRITHTDLLVGAVGRALRKHPRMNASWTADGIALHQDVNIAIAMAVDNAVVTAVVRGADGAALGDIAVRRRELADRARAGRLQPADIAGATFTISNLGMFEVDAFTAIIVPPQAGILAVGAIADRVVAVNGEVAIRPMMTLTLSSDHRVIDGARAAKFLHDVAAALREFKI
ncbi:MAG: Dihydrolipoamide acetyltransferase component of pyruvate dehydrogenase complex [Acidobacteria bacterium]|nr:Dihydrolipoamide acetyltransferase component of pyruvate dehydrogenase complex [Acidobacteriota bacterium]